MAVQIRLQKTTVQFVKAYRHLLPVSESEQPSVTEMINLMVRAYIRGQVSEKDRKQFLETKFVP